MVTSADFVACLDRGDPIGAARVGRALIAARSPLGDRWRSVAQFAAHVGECTLAIDAARLYLAAQPADVDRALFAADILATSGRLADAVGLVAHYARRDPSDARLHHLHGTALLELGRVEDGLAALYRAVTIWPQSGLSWLAIAEATDYASDPAALTKLEAVVPVMQGADATASAAWLYAIGKARSDRGEHERAFAAYSAGARLIRPERSYDRADDLAEARAIVAGCAGDWMPRARWSGPIDPDAPIFVTGQPRSGTTLVEQILASHTQVSDGGEINMLARVADPIGGTAPTALRRHVAAVGSVDAAWRPLRSRYRHMLTERFPVPGRAIDKSLNISRQAGLLHIALGDSPLIWLRRDPADTAWSSFRTFFATGLGWSFDLADMGHHFAVEDLLFEHWRMIFGERMLVVPYADLVQDTVTWIPRILNHCGLAIEPGVERFHETRRAVRTASVAQVRQPIYGHAVGSSAVQSVAMAPFDASYRTTRSSLGLA